jgi:hypothetical protein
MSEQTTIARKCPTCPTVQTVVVDAAAHERWQAGEYIQNAFPLLTANQREILMTGICPKCWDAMREATDPDADAECSGVCLTGADVGVPFDGIAYAHPDCPLHGESDGDIEVAPGEHPEYDNAAAASERAAEESAYDAWAMQDYDRDQMASMYDGLGPEDVEEQR